MRIVVALGGNALLRRGEPMTADNQRANIRTATEQIAKIHPGNELVIAHGNGPQVGLLALQGLSYKADEAYPLDVLGAETEGMIGYMIEQEPVQLLGELTRIWLVDESEWQQDGRLVSEWDEAFHCELVAATGNREMARIHREVTEKIRIIRRLDFTQRPRVEATYAEHAAILNAILHRRCEVACQLLRAHIEVSKAEVRKITLHMLHSARQPSQVNWETASATSKRR
ncbi:MAG: FCD domain-containing protein [Pseudomonas sp.]|nr:FCD domain-containing protein [Pseudomonas sp.]